VSETSSDVGPVVSLAAVVVILALLLIA